MSLLLDALKQAALEKKRQDGLAANQALSDDQSAADTIAVAREAQPSASQNKDVLGVEGIELSLDEVTPVEINADSQEIIEPQDSADIKSDEILDKPAENAKEQKTPDLVFGSKDFDYGHVELFEQDDPIAASTEDTITPTPIESSSIEPSPIEPSTITQASMEPEPTEQAPIKQTQDDSLTEVNESSVQQFSEQQSSEQQSP